MEPIPRKFLPNEKTKLRILVIFLTVFFSLHLTCKSKGALTPEDAFESLTRAYRVSNAQSIMNLLSSGSKQKIRSIIEMIISMNDAQLKSLSNRFGISVEKMKNLTIKDYISIQLAIGKKIGYDLIREIGKYRIVRIDVKQGRANVRVENGMELIFVKEGPYWKFDMEDL